MIVLHNESKKAVESYILDNYDVSTEDVQAVKNMLGNRSVNVTTELKNLFPDKNQEELYKVVGLLYSVINPAEMMSNLMNDKTYFDILKNTKYKNTTDTLLDRIKEFFIEAVQNLFPDIKEGTLAKAVINNMFETMSEQYTALDKLNSQDEVIDIKKEESKEEDSGMNTVIIFRRKEFEYKIEGFKDFVDNQSDEIIDIGSENSYTFEETNSGQSVEDLIEYEDWADMTTAERNKFKECN
jgi:hemoglobin-like flavoprotein